MPIQPTPSSTVPKVISPKIANHAADAKIAEPTKLIELDNDEALKRLKEIAKLSAKALPLFQEEETTQPTAIPVVTQATIENSIGTPEIKFRNKVDREDPRTEEKATVEILFVLQNLKYALEELRKNYKSAKTDDEKKEVEKQKKELLLLLGDLYKNILVETSIAESTNPKPYREILELLNERRRLIYDEIKTIERTKYDKERLSELNKEVIDINKLMLKVQIKLAGLILNGRSEKSKGANMMVHAQSMLTATTNSTHLLKEELHFRALRLEGAKQIRQIETVDLGGERVWTTKLENLDIKITAKEDASSPKEHKVTITKKGWINVHTTLDKIRLHIKKGEIEIANKKLDSLISLYAQRKTQVLENYHEITDMLKNLKAKTKTLQEGEKPDTTTNDDIKAMVEKLIALIKIPKHSIPMEIEVKDHASAVRMELHTLAGNKCDFETIIRNVAYIDYFTNKLRAAINRGFLYKGDRELIDEGTRKLETWTGKGFVYPKQFSNLHLQKALEHLAKGYEHDNIDEDDKAKKEYEAAQSCFIRTSSELNKRLNELKGIVEGVKGKATALYLKYRDIDVTARADSILKLVKDKNYKQALSEVNSIKENYFKVSPIEPGYIRVSNVLDEIGSTLQRLQRSNVQAQNISSIEAKIRRIKEDIEHKHTFRLHIFSIKAGQSLWRFINPGTSLRGLLKSLGVNPDTAYVSFGKGWIKRSDFENTMLNDETPTISISSTKPEKGFKVPQKVR